MSHDWLIPIGVGVALLVAVLALGALAGWSAQAQGTAAVGVCALAGLLRALLHDYSADFRP